MSTDSTTVRIYTSTHEHLRELSQKRGEPMPAILDQAVREYRDRLFWDEVDAAYRELQADPASWAEELEERKLWEATLMDGLEPE
jgi:predicted transcriptional regulator